MNNPLSRNRRGGWDGGSAAGRALLAVLCAAGCTDGPDRWHPEIYSEHHPARPAQSVSRNVGWQQIVFWAKDPANKEVVGYLETREVSVRDSLNANRQYFVYDRNSVIPFGFVNEVGITHVWRQGGAVGNGRWEQVGVYPLTDAMKALFKRPFRDHAGFEPMEYMPRLLD